MLNIRICWKAMLFILVWTCLGPIKLGLTPESLAQDNSGRSWWNPLGLGSGGSTSASSANKYSDFSGTPMTPAPESSMPKLEDGSAGSWQWPTLPTPQWKAPELSWPKPSWPSWMKSSGKSSSRSGSSNTSTWSRSTKRWWKNTTSMLNPFPAKGSGSVSSDVSGFSGGYSSSSSSGASNSSSWSLFNWWGVPEEKKLETPNDFFSLPKP